jgi:hypothetical protein
MPKEKTGSKHTFCAARLWLTHVPTYSGMARLFADDLREALDRFREGDWPTWDDFIERLECG